MRRRRGAHRDRARRHPPGSRVEGDVVELEPIFVRSGSVLSRGDGYPPHAERFAHAGYDLSRLLGHGHGGEQEGAA
jgi:pilus assembly protein CpaF